MKLFDRTKHVDRWSLTWKTATVVTIAGMLFQKTLPGAGWVALAGLLTVPGALLLQTLRLGRLSRLEQMLYAVALSILSLMVSGLVSNQLLHALGVAHPLASGWQIPWTGAWLLGLLALAGYRRRTKAETAPEPRRWAFNPSWPGVALATGLATLPMLSAAGAVTLNHGGSNVFTLASYLLIAGWAAGLVWAHRRVPKWVWPWALFTMGLALLWSTSLRGQFITGHDIQLEYYVFQLTDAGKFWSMSHLRDAYNACLSVTILPVVLKSLTGTGVLALYKVVYQIIFALVAVGAFSLARRFVSVTLASIAGFIFIAFPTFTTDMPMLTRQEIAFVFFMLLLLTLFNLKLTGWTRRILLGLMMVGVALSHYSTAFVMVALLGGTWAVMAGWRLVQKWRGTRVLARVRSLTFGVVVTAFLCVAIWSGLITKTGSNITAQFAKVGQAVPKLLHQDAENDSSAYAVPAGARLSSQEILNRYVASHHHDAEATAAAAGGFYLTTPADTLLAEDAPTLPLTRMGQTLQNLGLDPGLVVPIAKAGYAAAVEVAMLVGAALCLVYRRRFRLRPEFVALAPVAIGLLALQVVLPVIDYGLFRMLQQNLMFFGVIIGLGLMELLYWLKLRSEQLRLGLIASLFALGFLVTSGTLGQTLGGTGAALPLSNSGFYYDAYYTHRQDRALAAWLQDNYAVGYPINADMFTRMKVMAGTGITTLDGISPSELSQQSYVVLSGSNVAEGRVATYFRGHLLFFPTPTAFLDNNKNLLYSTDRTRVYH